MATIVVMPQMGYDMQQGTIIRWLKQEGEPIVRGEPIAEIETDKAMVEMEAYGSELLRKILVAEGVAVSVGRTIGIIAEPEEDISALEISAPSVAAPAAPEAPAPAPLAEAAPVPEPVADVRASPVARQLAQERGIDIAQVPGTGPGDRITRGDVESYVPGAVAPTPAPPAPAAQPAAEEAPGRTELDRMRQAIVRTATQSKQQVPHFYVTTEIDMTAATALRRQLNDALDGGVRVSFNDLVTKATALALGKFPNLNSFYVPPTQLGQEGYLETHPSIHIGIAIALENGGLVVPAIRNCQARSLAEIARARRDLVERAQQGRLRQDEYFGATFSTSNLGMYDVDSFSAIVLPPQAAVLAVGSVKAQPVVREDQIVVAQMMKVTISVDHRVSDGAEAARFLVELKRLLERPVILLV